MIAVALLGLDLMAQDPEGVIRIQRTDGSDLIVVTPDIYNFGAEPGDRIDVRFPGSDGIEEATFQALCDHWGCDRLVWSTQFDPAGEFVAESVDF